MTDPMTDPMTDVQVQPDADCVKRGHRLGTSAVNDLEALSVCLTCTAVWRVSFEEASHRTTFAEPEAKLEVALRVASPHGDMWRADGAPGVHPEEDDDAPN